MVVSGHSLFISLPISIPVNDKANIFLKVHINFGEHLGCFHFSAIMNRGAMSLFYTSFVEFKLAFFLIKDSGSIDCADSQCKFTVSISNTHPSCWDTSLDPGRMNST